MIDITEQDKKILEQFPKYDNKPLHWVGSRNYWESIFESEINRDVKLHEEFSKFHEKLVNEVIMFCKEHNLEVDKFVLSADGLFGSRDFGKWCPCTDSSMSMYAFKETDGLITLDEDPFLYEV